MIYLSQFEFPSKEKEFDFFLAQKRTCYDSFYPFQILSKHDLRILDFEPITILYGGNGSGKTTALNVIAEKLELERFWMPVCDCNTFSISSCYARHKNL